MFDCIKFGQTIRYFRKKRGLTILELSLELGISESYLGLIERGKKIPSSEIVILLVNTFGISIDDSYSLYDYTTNSFNKEIKDKLELFDELDFKYLCKLMTRAKTQEKLK